LKTKNIQLENLVTTLYKDLN